MKLLKSKIETPLGKMVAMGDEEALHWLGFEELCDWEAEKGKTSPINSIERELAEYFEGKRREFQTPLHCSGTPFQQGVWRALREIPYGKTISYLQLAKEVGKPTAYRAVAQANGANRFAVVIPCHRVISADGGWGGYGGGLDRKRWLLDHEKNLI